MRVLTKVRWFLSVPMLVVLSWAAPAGAQPTVSSVDHWGAFFGDHPVNNPDTLTAPTNISLPGTVKEVGSSNSTEYALLTDGTLWAWGQGEQGELGDGGSVDSFSTAVQVKFPAGVQIASIPTDVMPYDTGLAIDTTGHVWGWGYNQGGELCLGNTNEERVPVQLPLDDVTTAAGAGLHAFYVVNGRAFACGSGNAKGVLGTGTTTDSSVPVPVDLPGHSFVAEVVASFQGGGALLSDGLYYDWGANQWGQVGNGTNENVDVPYRVPVDQPVSQVAQGASWSNNGQTIVMLRDGTLDAWGNNTWGQLGDGKRSAYVSTPIVISPPAGVTYRTLAVAGGTSYAISTTGVLYAWGDNGAGEVGDGSRTEMVLTPTAVDSGVSLISATANNVVVGS